MYRVLSREFPTVCFGAEVRKSSSRQHHNLLSNTAFARTILSAPVVAVLSYTSMCIFGVLHPQHLVEKLATPDSIKVAAREHVLYKELSFGTRKTNIEAKSSRLNTLVNNAQFTNDGVLLACKQQQNTHTHTQTLCELFPVQSCVMNFAYIAYNV